MTTKSTLMSLNEASRDTTLSRTYLNRLRAVGKFPAAVPLGDKRVAFVRKEVEAWIVRRIEARAVAAAKREVA